jgi:hypothetical protein
MADWGALLATDNGAPFITPQSIPLALIGKQSVALKTGSGEITTISQAIPAGRPVIPFVCSTINCVLSYAVSGNTCTVSASKPEGAGTVHVDFFTILAQPLPAWGIAIWDEQGTCILTNETRVLTDIEAIGTNGSDTAGGYNINVTRSGKVGIVPSMCGLVTGVITSGGTRPFMSQYFFSAVVSGGSTKISVATSNGTPSGPITNIAYHNMRNRVYALNLDNYD